MVQDMSLQNFQENPTADVENQLYQQQNYHFPLLLKILLTGLLGIVFVCQKGEKVMRLKCSS